MLTELFVACVSARRRNCHGLVQVSGACIAGLTQAFSAGITQDLPNGNGPSFKGQCSR